MPGSEIVGQTLQVQKNGVTNSVVLSPGGQAQITTPGGNVIPATWTAANGQLCLNTGAAQECWAYTTAFQPGQPLTLSSNCGDCNLAREFDQRTVTATGAGTAGRTRLGHTASVDIAGGSVAADQKIVIAAASDGAAELVVVGQII